MRVVLTAFVFSGGLGTAIAIATASLLLHILNQA